MKNRCEIYDKMSKKWIPVTESVHKAYCQEIDIFRRKEQRRGHCKCPRSKWWTCDCDCLICEFYIGSEFASLDEPIGEDEMDLIDSLPSNMPSTEDIAADNEFFNALWDELSELSDEDFKICQLLVNYSKTEAAKKMGISRDALNRRCKKLQIQLGEKLKKFF